MDGWMDWWYEIRLGQVISEHHRRPQALIWNSHLQNKHRILQQMYSTTSERSLQLVAVSAQCLCSIFPHKLTLGATERGMDKLCSCQWVKRPDWSNLCSQNTFPPLPGPLWPRGVNTASWVLNKANVSQVKSIMQLPISAGSIYAHWFKPFILPVISPGLVRRAFLLD